MGNIKKALAETFNKSIETGLEYNEGFKERKKMIATRIKELRVKNGYTQEEVAKKININRTTYAGYEKERTEPSAEVLARLAVLYDVSLDYIFDLTANPYGRYNQEEKKEKANSEIEEIKKQMQELQEKINSLE
ncbi:MAG: helix-turn-helix transcriptional regulator [Oscillospiraceae bacterium]|nr:helix-turn-helix transcriptional regulator [Oscillospiraceae bacterium]